MDDKWETRKQWSTEALACPCKHISVIKFLVIHIETMEVYTLCWNGGPLWKMLDYSTKYSFIIDNLGYGRANMIVAFRQNCVKLAWAFINIMNEVYHCGILHNNLSKDNIMLHFSTYKPCCNPSLGLAIKARACKVGGQEGSPGVIFHALGNEKECEGVNPFTPKWTPIVGVGVSNGLLNFQRAITRVKIHWIETFSISMESTWNLDV